MGRYLLGGRYLWSLLQRLGKGLRICAEELGLEVLQALEEDDHRTTNVLALVPVLAPHDILQVPEVDIVQGPTLLPQEGEVTTPFPLKERMVLDHQETLHHKNEMLITFGGHIPQVMITLLIEMTMGMAKNLDTIPRMNVLGGGPHQDEHQDHLLKLGPGLGPGLLICRPAAADE